MGSSASAPRRPAGTTSVGTTARVPSAAASAGRTTSRQANPGASDAALAALTAQMGEMKVSVEGLEKERDFYFNKLRDIEILIGARLEAAENGEAEVGEEERGNLLQMQQILYSTEEGFEVPEGEEEGEGLDGEAEAGLAVEDEEETFVSRGGGISRLMAERQLTRSGSVDAVNDPLHGCS